MIIGLIVLVLFVALLYEFARTMNECHKQMRDLRRNRGGTKG